MRRYIMYFQQYDNGHIEECVGSDSLRGFDNRLSNNTIINKILNEKHTFPVAIGFKICRLNRYSCNYLTDLIRIENGNNKTVD